MFSGASRGIPSFGDMAWKRPARLQTPVVLPANTRTGNVLTATANGALPTIDGVAPVVNDRILVWRELTGANNGIYTVTNLGSVGTKWILTRATDADVAGETVNGASVFVNEGTLGTRQFFVATGVWTINVTDPTFRTYALAWNNNGVEARTPADIAFALRVIGETIEPSIIITKRADANALLTLLQSGGGTIVMGAGGATAPDTALGRSAAKTLAIDDSTGGTIGTGGPVILRLLGAFINGLISQIAAVTTEGSMQWDDTHRVLTIGDSVQSKAVTPAGWAARALPASFASTDAFATSAALPINGGAIAIPMVVSAPMQLQGYILRNLDTANLRTCEISLYQTLLQNSATVNRIGNSGATLSFTPVAASTRTALLGASIVIAPGFYWLVIRNTSATQTFGFATSTVPTFNPNASETKTLAAALGASLDIVTGWTKSGTIGAVAMQGLMPDSATGW